MLTRSPDAQALSRPHVNTLQRHKEPWSAPTEPWTRRLDGSQAPGWPIEKNNRPHHLRRGQPFRWYVNLALEREKSAREHQCLTCTAAAGWTGVASSLRRSLAWMAISRIEDMMSPVVRGTCGYRHRLIACADRMRHARTQHGKIAREECEHREHSYDQLAQRMSHRPS